MVGIQRLTAVRTIAWLHPDLTEHPPIAILLGGFDADVFPCNQGG